MDVFLAVKLTGVDRFAIELLRAWDNLYANKVSRFRRHCYRSTSVEAKRALTQP